MIYTIVDIVAFGIGFYIGIKIARALHKDENV